MTRDLSCRFGPNPVTPPPNGSIPVTLLVSVYGLGFAGTYDVPVVAMAANTRTRTAAVSMTVTEPSTRNFGVWCEPTDLGTLPGGTISTTCLPDFAGTFDALVSFDCQDLPPGITCNFDPPVVEVGAGDAFYPTRLLVSVPSGTAPGNYGLRIRGTSDSVVHSFRVAVKVGDPGKVVFFDDFETPSGWRTDPNGTDTATGGYWEQADPDPTGFQSAHALSGANELVTGHLGGPGVGADADDVDGGTTSIASPPITLPASGPLTLSFQYYLAHYDSPAAPEDSFRAKIVGPSSTTTVFESLSTSNFRVPEWAPVIVDLRPFAGQMIRVLFEASDDGYETVVEAAVDDVAITRTAPVPGNVTAALSTTLQAPRCLTIGRSCDSGPTLLAGRGAVPPGESNRPNTILDLCADGDTGTFHVDESNDRIRVATVDGGGLAPGKTVRVSATVWAGTTFTSDQLDLYYAADATNPAWTFIKTLRPSKAGSQVLEATYDLPAGTFQAVRAQFRRTGPAPFACIPGPFNDHDDLVFAVLSVPPKPLFTDGFETARGWSTNPDGTDTATTGLWERGDPEETSFYGVKQLGTTVGGVNDLVTGRLAGASPGVNDVDGGVTSIVSPPITLPRFGRQMLTFQYYLAHGANSSSADCFRAGYVDQYGFRTLPFSACGARRNRNGSWTGGSMRLDTSAEYDQTIRIIFEANDGGEATLVEAGVDNVKITQEPRF